MATPRLDQFILSLIKVESATDIPIVIEKVNYVNNSFLNANNDELIFGLELQKGDSCQGKFWEYYFSRRKGSKALIKLI